MSGDREAVDLVRVKRAWQSFREIAGAATRLNAEAPPTWRARVLYYAIRCATALGLMVLLAYFLLDAYGPWFLRAR